MALKILETPGVHPLRRPVEQLIWHKYRNTPRHVQVELGPSEIGEDCTRKLAYNLMHHEKCNVDSDPLPSIVGTAAHTWLTEACEQWNRDAGRIDWIPELSVNVDGPIKGHSDAYHVPTRRVVDWKFPGTEPLKKYRGNGPSTVYRSQVHCYGKGVRRLGLEVDEVAIVFFPRGGMLSGAYYWSEPYDESVADAALKRYWDLTELCVELEVDVHPDRYKLIEMTPGHHCTYCPWFSATGKGGDGCPGFTK